jgi:hypothetical protein
MPQQGQNRFVEPDGRRATAGQLAEQVFSFRPAYEFLVTVVVINAVQVLVIVKHEDAPHQ